MYLLVLICLISEYGRQQTHLSVANIFLQKDSLQNTCPATCPVGQVILVQDNSSWSLFSSFQDRCSTFLCNCVLAIYENWPIRFISKNPIIILTFFVLILSFNWSTVSLIRKWLQDAGQNVTLGFTESTMQRYLFISKDISVWTEIFSVSPILPNFAGSFTPLDPPLLLLNMAVFNMNDSNGWFSWFINIWDHLLACLQNHFHQEANKCSD